MATDRIFSPIPIWGEPLPGSCEEFPSPRPVQLNERPPLTDLNQQQWLRNLAARSEQRLLTYAALLGKESRYQQYLDMRARIPASPSSPLHPPDSGTLLPMLRALDLGMNNDTDLIPFEIGVRAEGEVELRLFDPGIRTAGDIPVEYNPKFQQLFNLIRLYARGNPTGQKLFRDFWWFSQRTPLEQGGEMVMLCHYNIDLTKPLSPENVNYIRQVIDFAEMKLPPSERRGDLRTRTFTLSQEEVIQLQHTMEVLKQLPRTELPASMNLFELRLQLFSEAEQVLKILKRLQSPEVNALETKLQELSLNHITDANAIFRLEEFIQSVIGKIFNPELKLSFTPTALTTEANRWMSDSKIKDFRRGFNASYERYGHELNLEETALRLYNETDDLMEYLVRTGHPNGELLRKQFSNQIDIETLNSGDPSEAKGALRAFRSFIQLMLEEIFRDPPSGSASGPDSASGGEPPPVSGRSSPLSRSSIEFGMNVGMMTLLLITQEELERNRFLTPNQVNLLNLGLLGSTALVHPYTVGMTAVGLLPFQVGKQGVILLANATGVEAVQEGKFLNRALGTFAGVATSAAVAFSPAGKQAAIILQDRSLQASVNLANRIEDFVFANYALLKTGLSMTADYFKISYLQPAIAAYTAARVFVSNPLPYLTPILEVASKMGGLLLVLPLPKNGNFSLVRESDGEDTKI